MPDQTKYYITGAFVLGAALATFYRLQESRRHQQETSSNKYVLQQRKILSSFSHIQDLDTLKRSLAEIEQNLGKGSGDIKEGIEGCIGDTPLIKIKSLSKATGCEILAKAEVWAVWYVKNHR